MNTQNSESYGTYRHYKGNTYEVIGFGYHTETEEKLVFYRDLQDNDKLWARPYDMFFDTVIIDGVEKQRFERMQTDEDN
jgi:hypothetical protein